MSALCSLSVQGVYDPKVPLKSLTNTQACTHTCIRAHMHAHSLCSFISQAQVQGSPLFLQALIYRSLVRVKGSPQMEKCVLFVGGVCLRVCVSVHICAHEFVSAHVCFCVRRVHREIKKEKPSSKRLQDAMELESLFGCLVIFPINHS